MADEQLSRFDQADRSLRYYGKWAAAAAVAPPVVDLAAVAGVQLKMLADLAKVYDVPFRSDLGKAAIGALIGTLVPNKLGYGAALLAARSIPLVGSIVGAATLPVFYYASTVAVGRVFQKHFASGGTLLDFKAEAVKDEVAHQARAAADEMKAPASRRTAEVQVKA